MSEPMITADELDDILSAYNEVAGNQDRESRRLAAELLALKVPALVREIRRLWQELAISNTIDEQVRGILRAMLSDLAIDELAGEARMIELKERIRKVRHEEESPNGT